MRKLEQWVLLLVLTAAAAPLFGASAADFYVGLLRRGVADVEAGRNETAVTPLRLAAFGLVESVEHYQLAQAHLVVALDRMNQTEPAREAALRLVAAERVERKFAAIGLSPAIRTAFTTSARKLLTPTDAALLLTAPSQQSTPAQTSAKPPQNDTVKKPVTEATSRPVVEKRPEEKPPEKPVEKPAEKPPTPAPAPVTTPSSTTRKPEDPKTPPAAATQKPAPAQPAPAKPVVDVPARLAAGERALIAANLVEARKTYRELLDTGGHDHATWIRVAEGLYRSRDFQGALSAFQRVGTLRSGEEAYHYYIAVALYETGQYDRAKRELATALPYIEVTPDVQRYRGKIEGAR